MTDLTDRAGLRSQTAFLRTAMIAPLAGCRIGMRRERRRSMGAFVPEVLRKRLSTLAGTGLSLAGLTSELDRYRDQLRGEQYDELWLYCWALTR